MIMFAENEPFPDLLLRGKIKTPDCHLFYCSYKTVEQEKKSALPHKKYIEVSLMPHLHHFSVVENSAD